MSRTVNAIYIIHQDGIPLFTVKLEETSFGNVKSFEELFGGFTSAINTLIAQLGHKRLKSIEVENGLLVYSLREPVISVAYTEDPHSERFAEILIRQIEYELFKEYGDFLKQEDAYIRGEKYLPFKKTVTTLYQQMCQITNEFPHFLEFLPEFVPLHYIYMVLNLGVDIIKNYPDDTIKLVRDLPLYFGDDKKIEQIISQTLGRYSGFRIAKERLKEKVVDLKSVLKLLNEISVTKYDRKNDVFDVRICPICRGKTADVPICNFFSGFIEGALGNPRISVREIACKAQGDSSCMFKLERQI